MEKYWYFSAEVFRNDQKTLLCLSTGTTKGVTFPLSLVVKVTAEKVGVSPRCVSVTFFTEISQEEHDKLEELKKEEIKEGTFAIDDRLKEKVIKWLDSIADEAVRLTSGNASHLGASIKGRATRAKEYILSHT